MSEEGGTRGEYRWYKENSDRTLERVSDAQTNEGKLNAMQEEFAKTIGLLKDEYSTGSAFRFQFKQYENQVISGLQKKDKELLPALAIVYAQGAMGQLDKSGEGSLSAGEIKEAIDSKSTSRIEKMMLSTLLDGNGNINQRLRWTHRDPDQNGVELNEITLRDLEAASPPSKQRSNTPLERRQFQQQEYDMQVQRGIVSPPSPEVPLPRTRIDIVGLELSADQTYRVRKGDRLMDIASKALSLRGQATDDQQAIAVEAARIVQLNSNKYPQLLKSPNKIDERMVLKIHDDTVGPDAQTAWKPWEATHRGEVVVTKKGDSLEVRSGSRAIVRSGSRVVLLPGSQGFATHGGRVVAYAGSEVTAAEGAIVETHPGAAVTYVQEISEK